MKASINILCFGTEFYEFVFEYDVSALTWHRNRPTNESLVTLDWEEESLQMIFLLQEIALKYN